MYNVNRGVGAKPWRVPGEKGETEVGAEVAAVMVERKRKGGRAGKRGQSEMDALALISLSLSLSLSRSLALSLSLSDAQALNLYAARA